MMERYQIYTTVDITPTGVTENNLRADPELLQQRNQQRNYDTLLQVLSLRAHVYEPHVWIENGRMVEFDPPGSPSEYNVWMLTFAVEHPKVFGPGCIAFLNDVHLVPIIPALNETVPIFPPYFMSRGEYINVAIQEYVSTRY